MSRRTNIDLESGHKNKREDRMTSNPIQPMSNGTPECRRARGILCTNTKFSDPLLQR